MLGHGELERLRQFFREAQAEYTRQIEITTQLLMAGRLEKDALAAQHQVERAAFQKYRQARAEYLKALDAIDQVLRDSIESGPPKAK